MRAVRIFIVTAIAVVAIAIAGFYGIKKGYRHEAVGQNVAALATPTLILPPTAIQPSIPASLYAADGPVSCSVVVPSSRLKALEAPVILYGSFPTKRGATAMTRTLKTYATNGLVTDSFFRETTASWQIPGIHRGYTLGMSVTNCTLGPTAGFVQHLFVTLSGHGLDDAGQPWQAVLPYDVSIINFGDGYAVYNIADQTPDNTASQ